jgi:hypothetical protein
MPLPRRRINFADLVAAAIARAARSKPVVDVRLSETRDMVAAVAFPFRQSGLSEA